MNDGAAATSFNADYTSNVTYVSSAHSHITAAFKDFPNKPLRSYSFLVPLNVGIQGTFPPASFDT